MVKNTFIGGLGERYCSQECYEAGGATVTKHLLDNWTGDCSVCRVPVFLHFGSPASMVCWKPGLFLFHCGSPSCIDTVKLHVQQTNVCPICGAPLSVKCDVCSKGTDEEEIRVAPGSEVVDLSMAGYVPIQFDNVTLALLHPNMGLSKAQLWNLAVGKKIKGDWVLCESCFSGFKAYQQFYQKRQVENSQRREEATRQETLRRAEAKRRDSIIKKRKLQEECYFCGRPLGIIYKILKITHHLNCNERNARF